MGCDACCGVMCDVWNVICVRTHANMCIFIILNIETRAHTHELMQIHTHAQHNTNAYTHTHIHTCARTVRTGARARMLVALGVECDARNHALCIHFHVSHILFFFLQDYFVYRFGDAIHCRLDGQTHTCVFV